jgi:PST family polysaccharide transporter
MTLRARVAAGVGWTGSVHWLGVAVATVTTAVVARFVVPADYAIVAAAGALAGIVGVVQESGIGAAVVQHAGDGDRAATTGFVLNLAGATAALAVCFALTPWVARFFDIDQPGALALAFTPLWLRAWSNVPLARLEKALDFRRCAVVEAVQVLAYPALTIPLAIAGHGAWALVIGQAGAAAAGALGAWLVSPWRPRRAHLDWATGQGLLHFGRPLVWANLLGIANDRIDNWVTGLVLGPAALGVYAMAFRLATLPRTGFTFVVSRVLFPAMTVLRDDERRFRAAFLRAFHWVGVLALPASAGLALLAPDIVAVTLGPRWTGTAAPLRVLAVFALLASLSATTGDVFKAAGRSPLIFRIGLAHSAVLWTGLALLAGRGVTAVAVAVSGATLVSTVLAFACAARLLRLGVGALLRPLLEPALASVIMALAIQAGRSFVPAGAVGVIVLVGLGGAVYAGAVAVLAPGDVRELAGMVAAARGRRVAETAVAPG